MSEDTKKISNTKRKPPNAGKGRPKGAVNKVTADVRALASQFGSTAIHALAEIMEDKEQPAAARVSAAKEILDRAYGKSPQPISAGEGNMSELVGRLLANLPA